MKFVIPGGTGQVGTVLARAFTADGHDVTVISRAPRPAPWTVLEWDGRTIGPWTQALEGADAVINLAGYTVNCRYNPANRRRIMESRVDSTRAMGRAIRSASNPPRVWLQSSTATIYSHRYEAANDERSGQIGGREKGVPETWRFSIEVASAWEQAVDQSETPGTRKIKLRSAMIMSPDQGGVFDTLLGLVRRGLGGRSGDGRQFVSWIHEQDFIRALCWLMEHDDFEGIINLASPNPLPNADFMRDLRKAWGIGFGLPASAWMLEIGALFLRTETELILKSRRVRPGLLLEQGFEFQHPEWPDAARDLVEAWKSRR